MTKPPFRLKTVGAKKKRVFPLLAAVAVLLVGAGTLRSIYRREAESWWRAVSLNLGYVSLPLLLLLVAVGVALIVLLWQLPRWQAAQSAGASDENLFTRENEARQTLAQIVGGTLVLAGLYASVQTLNLAREGQITDRFTKATEQLGALDEKGHTKLEVRLGGIYALERIARDSGRDHRVIMEILTAYVRVHAARKPEDAASAAAKAPTSTQEEVPQVSADIQAIITVLGRREVKYDEIRYSEDGLNLSNVDLRKIIFSGNFSNAHFQASKLQGADFSGVDLTDAHFTGADLRSANLRGAKLRSDHFSSANFEDADLRGTDVRGADLRGADNLAQGQLGTANGDSQTFIPAYLKIPTNWAR